MEYEKDCSLTDEVVPVDFTICMNEQAVISVSEYTRLKCKSREYNVGNGKNMNRNGRRRRFIWLVNPIGQNYRIYL